MTNLIQDLYQETINRVNDLNLPKGRRIVSVLKGHLEMVPATIENEDLTYYFNRAKDNILDVFNMAVGMYIDEKQANQIIEKI